ncbi:phage portal protein [Pontibacillus litoralis]|uniref:Portal protein n=1 Tax=Pontibacillus litoralis JSM 072002 TaxID=1385512 RepID=A0A0A5FW96_9BACI|nr:phage portal protein [Pontibacillus litoralis]KGX85036.1 hypothetical protein N784_11110 [Pontibacillus litoralis JSM 072002]
MAENKQRFSKEANKTYTYKDADSLLANLGDLTEIVNHHLSNQVSRLSELDDYYLGNNRTILNGDRRKEEHMADHRATHNHARYVSQFIVGYLTGSPIEVMHNEQKVQDTISYINDINNADAINSELTLDCSVYGRAYELIFRSQDDETRFTLLSPLETFVIYDDTVEQKAIAGIRHRTLLIDGENTLIVEVYTNSKIYTYHANEDGSDYKLVDEKAHYFDGVPINEYQNNRFRQGDFENVLNLIDLYDASQSDLANYSQDLQDAMLVIKGRLDLMGDNVDPVQRAKEMKQANILYMEPEMGTDGKEDNVDARYIYKQYDVAGMEAYKTRLTNDIHKFTNVPNMNDEKFAGTQSGESMKYKLFGLEQVRASKERYFKRSMKNRYRLINNIMATGSELPKDTLNNISIEFTPNFPKNTKEQIDIFNSLGGEVSNETALSLLPYEIDIEAEKKCLSEEQENRRQTSSYMDVES